MKKIVSGLLMGLFFVGCTEQETTYTIQGEWEGGDGKVVYLKKDLGDKKYEILDSAVVVKGSFKMQKPLGDVDERILEINGGTNIIILDSVPIHVKCETVKKMIGRQKAKYGWEFLFLGANIDAGREAEKIGIARNRSVTYENDSKGVELNFKAVGKAISKAVESDAMMDFMDDHWADEIEAYKEGKK